MNAAAHLPVHPAPRTGASVVLAVLALFAVAAVTCAGLFTSGCAGVPLKPAGDGVQVSLRRIDVVDADFERMKLEVILAVENSTSSNVAVAADAAIILLGEAVEASASADVTDADGVDGDGEPGAPAGATQTPFDGTRHVGRGSGTASAQNTSELPVVIDLPLPADPALLEQLLDWRKVRVQVTGTVRLGFEARAIDGQLEVAPPRLPEVRLKEAQVASADGGAAGTGFFTLLVQNKNSFPVTLSRMAWTVTIKDKELQPSAGSGPTEVVNDAIEGNQVGEYGAEVQIDQEAFGKDLKTILKSRSVPYVVQGTLDVRGIQRSFRFAGEMKFPR